METYYVTKLQLEFISMINDAEFSLDELLDNHVEAKNMFGEFSTSKGNALLRYLGGDKTIEFKVQEPLYRLWATDQYGAKVYFKRGRNIWSNNVTEFTNNVFEAPLDEITKWKTPAWEIEEAN